MHSRTTIVVKEQHLIALYTHKIVSTLVVKWQPEVDRLLLVPPAQSESVKPLENMSAFLSSSLYTKVSKLRTRVFCTK